MVGQRVAGAVDKDDMNADAAACFARNQEIVALRLYENYIIRDTD